MSGNLFIISGPSGVGKTTLLDELFKKDDKLVFSISATTREKRSTEKNGVDYFYVSIDEFEKKIKNKEFLEWAKVFDNYYGTPEKFVDKTLKNGFDCILDIDVQGALQIMSKRKDAVSVFVAPQNKEELLKRLKGRNTETQSVIDKRNKVAGWELNNVDKYDYVVVNDNIENAVTDLYSIIKSQRRLVKNNAELVKSLKKEIYKS